MFYGYRCGASRHPGKNAFALEPLWTGFAAFGKKARQGVAGNDPEEWRKTVLITPAGQLYVEGSYIYASLRAGAARTRNGRGTLQPLITATLQVENDRVLLNRWLPKKTKLSALHQAESEPVYLDVRPVRNPATKARNIRYRVAASPGWETDFKISWDNTVISEHQMEAVTRDAGQFAGIGDARNIGRGRFEVVSFTILSDSNAKKPLAKRAVGSSSR